MECPPNEVDCEPLRDFVVSQLRTQYYVEKYLPPCPALNESLKWRIMQIDSSQCQGSSDSATCSVGRMRITVQPVQNPAPFVAHATVLGCAKPILLRGIQKAFTDTHKCHLQLVNQTQNGVTYFMELEHCRLITDLCHDKDFCVDYKQSVIKSFKMDEKKYSFEFGLMFSIIAIAVIILAALIGASLCRSPLNRASNLPKSTVSERPINITVKKPVPSTSGTSAAAAASKLMTRKAPSESSL